MRSKPQCSSNLKLILLSLFFFSIILLVLRASFTSYQQSAAPSYQTHLSNSTNPTGEAAVECPSLPLTASCSKTPPSLAHALVHYATSNVTPQQTLKEISVSERVLARKAPCNFLVFGLGHDSLMWSALNHGGRTVFLEEDLAWIEQVRERLPVTVESHHVTYETKVKHAEELMRAGVEDEECRVVTDPRFSKCGLALKGFPSDIYDVEWDVIMVDAPTGYHEEAPGRMGAIYTAGLMARNRESGETEVFVHDVDRPVEDKFSRAFLCEGYLVEQEGRIRHFTVPSHRARSGRPFCPP